MTNSLAPRYARYGMLASLTLAALEELERRSAAREPARLETDDAARLERLHEILAASFAGGVAPARAHQLAHWPRVTNSSSSSIEDSTVVKSVLPADCELSDFVPAADRLLYALRTAGIAGLTNDDRDFLDGSFKDFLRRLARSQQAAPSVGRRSRRPRQLLV